MEKNEPFKHHIVISEQSYETIEAVRKHFPKLSRQEVVAFAVEAVWGRFLENPSIAWRMVWKDTPDHQLPEKISNFAVASMRDYVKNGSD